MTHNFWNFPINWQKVQFFCLIQQTNFVEIAAACLPKIRLASMQWIKLN